LKRSPSSARPTPSKPPAENAPPTLSRSRTQRWSTSQPSAAKIPDNTCTSTSALTLPTLFPSILHSPELQPLEPGRSRPLRSSAAAPSGLRLDVSNTSPLCLAESPPSTSSTTPPPISPAKITTSA